MTSAESVWKATYKIWILAFTDFIILGRPDAQGIF